LYPENEKNKAVENKDQNSAVPNGQTLGDLNSSSSELSDGGVVQEPLDTNALSLEPGVPEPLISQEQRKRQANPFLRFVRRADVILVTLLILGAVGFIFTTTRNNDRSKDDVSNQTTADRFGTVKIPLGDLVSGKDLSLAGVANVTINGSIQVNDSLVLTPSLQPTGAKSGQIYYDQGTNQLAYFNGSNFVFLTGASAGGVQSLGGATGLLTLGTGLSAAGSQIANSGVLSVQGQNGPVTFTAGAGIVINGTNFSNSGVISVSSDDPDITVTNDGQGSIKLSVTGSGTGTVTSGGGSAGYIPLFTASQNIEDSVITQSGLTVTITGDLSVVTGGLTLSNALSVPNGGTGSTSFAANGLLVGHGTASVTSVAAAGAGLCLLSTAGAPTWAACPSGSGVTSVNGLTGGLNIANASGSGTTITIDDASTTNKGIASFNGTNFSVTGGAVNTVQNIDNTATPTFAGVNTNTITPSAALTVGSTSQTALLQGSTTTITSTGAGNDVVLNAADTIELQDNTNITGNLDISGTIAIGTGNAFQVDATGSVTAAGTGVFQGGSLALGTTSQAGSLILNDGSANTGTLQVAALAQNTIYTLPDPGAGSATICLSTGNCAGTGGGVTTPGGSVNRLAKFSGAQAVADSTISDDGVNVTTSVDMIIQGGNVTVGLASAQTGSISLAHSGSAFLGSIIQGALTANRSYTLPDASGTVCLSSGNCSGSGSSSTLQAAYDAGNSIATTDGRDISFTLADTTVDSNFAIGIETGSTGFVSVSRGNGAGTADPAQLLLIQNLDTDRTQPVGISVQAATGGGMTTGIDLSDADIVDAINVGANNIVGTTGNIDLTSFDVVGSTGSITTAGDVAVNGGDITSSGALNITPGGTLTVGVTGQQLVLQGNANTQLTATGGGFTTTVGFAGTPTANVTYNFDRAASTGTYTICTTIGNCAGSGGGVTTVGGTTGAIAKFTGSQTLGDSLLSESGSVVTVNGNLNLVSGNQFTVNGTQISSANLSNDANLAKLSASQTFTGNAVSFQNGTNSSNAFNIQNAAGNRVVSVDTTNGQVVLGTASALSGSLVFQNMTNTNTVTVLPGTPTANRTLTFPDASGVICTDSGNCAGAGATLQTAYNFSVGGTTPKIKLNSTLVGFDIQDADTTIGANLLNIRASSGAGLGSVLFGVGSTGQVTLQNNANSTTALRLLTSGGTNVLTGDTTNGQIILGQSSTLNGTLVFNNSSNGNSVTLSSAAATSNRNILLPDSSGTICLTSGNCSGSGSSNTLQASYDAGNTITATTGRDVLVTLADLATDPNFIINLQCDTACGANGRFALQDDGVDTFTVSPAGGAIAIQPTSDTTTAFNMKTSLNNNIFTIDSLNSRLGFNLGASNLPTVTGSAGFELKGALRLSGGSGTYADSYITPLGASIASMINVLNYNPGAFSQIIALGLPSTADTNARAISLLDARASAHQPTLAVISPNENEIGGFSWDGSNTAFRVKNSASGTIALNVFGTDRLTASTTGVTINGAIDQSGGAITMVGNNTSSISTTSGSLTLQSVSGANNIVINGSANTMTLNTGAAGTITVGSSNTTTVNVGAQTNNARTVNVGYAASSQAQTVNIGAPASTGVTSIYSGSGGTVLTSTGSTVVKQSGTATTTAFQVQNVAGTQTYFNVDALNGRAGVGTASPNAQLDVVGYIPSAATASVSASNLVYNVVTSGKYAYSANFAALQVWDITRPSAPVSIATASTTNNGVSFVRVYGRYAVNVVTTWDSIDIFDISNPGSPVKLKNMTVTSTDDVAISGRYMYIATSDGSNNLHVYDIINPANPVLVGSFPQTNLISEMTIQGRYMYASSGFSPSKLVVYDLSNPASPSQVGIVNGPTSSGKVKVVGRYAFVASGTTLQAFNVANPASPASVGTVAVSNAATDISIQGRYAYVSSDNTSNVINVIDISNPASMSSVGSIATGTYIRGVAVQGRYLYGADYGNSALKVYDIGGTYTQGLEAGSVTASNVDVSGSLKVAGDAQFTSGARVDGNIDINGTLGLNGTQSIQTTTNSANAFQIQNSAGTQLLNVGTVHNTADLITNGSLEQNATGWAARGSSTISRITSQQYIGSASLQVATTALANDGVKYPITLSANTTYTAGFYIKLSSGTFTTLNYGYSSDGSTETDCKTGQQSKTGGWMIMNCTFTTAGSVTGSPYFYIKQTDATARTFYIDAFQMVPGSDIGAYYEGKINTAGTIFSGPVAIQNDNNSQSVFQVQDSVGTTLLGVDAVNYRVGIGLIKAQATLDVVSVISTNVALSVTQHASSTSDILRLAKSGSSDVLDIAHTGATTFQNNTNSATAFRILDSAGTTTIFDVDSTNKRVGIGNNAPTRTLDVSISTSSTNTLPLLLQQSSTGDTGLELKTSTKNFYVGVDNTDGQFKISSATSANGTFTLGNTGVVANTDFNDMGAQALKTTASASGSVSSMSVYIDTLDPVVGNRLIQVGVYSDNGSGTSPNALLGSSVAQTAVVGWNTIPLSGITVTSGTVYWIAMAENGDNLFSSNSSGGVTAYHITNGYPLPNPYAANTGNSAENPAFYITVANNGSADNFNGTNMFTLSDTGATTFKNATDTTGAFRVLNAAGASLFTVDTTSSRVYVGDPTADSTGALLVLDNKNTSGDPTGVEGAMYYNSNLGALRCYQYDSWRDCIDNSPRTSYHVYEELNDSNGTDSMNTWGFIQGGGSIDPIAGAAGHPGISRLSVTDNTTPDLATIQAASNTDNGILLGNGTVWRYETSVRLPSLSTSGQRMIARLGFLDVYGTTEGAGDDGCYFRYSDNLNSGKWQGICVNNGTTTTCDLMSTSGTTVAASTWYRLTVTVNSAGTSADFQVNGATTNGSGRCQVASNIPTSAGRETSYANMIIKTVGTATVRQLDNDYIDVLGQFSTPR
jgi:hypothetical protein